MTAEANAADRTADRPAAGTLGEPLACAAAGHLLRYPYKTWGFGEDIGLRALLELGDATGDARYAGFVHGLVRRWFRTRGPLEPKDHVAPGVVLLELAGRFGDRGAMDAALELGRLLTGFPKRAQVALHRRDLAPWRGTIWVDCMGLDAPFLARLARATGEDAWAWEAASAATGYARALQDPGSGLFFHGFDTRTRRTSACRWGRGNGWALHGLVDALEALPRGAPGTDELRARLRRLVAALLPLQHASGLWHTVLDDASTPLERSTAALFASGLLKARRLGLLPREPGGGLDTGWDDGLDDRLDPCLDAAIGALADGARRDGGLEVSSATPVGERATYAGQPLGIYPWGQGPLILCHVEGRRASRGMPA